MFRALKKQKQKPHVFTFLRSVAEGNITIYFFWPNVDETGNQYLLGLNQHNLHYKNSHFLQVTSTVESLVHDFKLQFKPFPTSHAPGAIFVQKKQQMKLLHRSQFLLVKSLIPDNSDKTLNLVTLHFACNLWFITIGVLFFHQ